MSHLPETRDSLLLRLVDPADHQAWCQFTEIYRPVIYGLARRQGLQEADAQEVAQRVLVSVSGAVGRWTAEPRRARFRTWLHRVARNAIIDQLRSARPDMAEGGTAALDRLQAEADNRLAPEDVDGEYQRQLFRWAARQIRDEFQRSTWLAFWRTAVDGCSISDVAEELRKSVGAIYIARSRVMQRLREKVREYETDMTEPDGFPMGDERDEI